MLGFAEHLNDFLPPSGVAGSSASSKQLGKVSFLVQTESSTPSHQPKKWVRAPLLTQGSTRSTISVWQPEGSAPRITRPFGEELLVPAYLDTDTWNLTIRGIETDWQDKTETDLLLSLYRSCGGRWPVIHDRWQSDPVYGSKGRTLESLKARFAKVFSKLQDSPSLRYSEIYDQHRRQFLDQHLQKDPAVVDQQQRQARELFRSKLRLKGKPENPRVGVFTAAALAKHPELSPVESEKVKAAAAALGLDLFGTARTLRVQRLLAGIVKQLHCLVLLKESVATKIRDTESLAQNNQQQSVVKVKFGSVASNSVTKAVFGATAKKRKNDE